MYNIYTMKRMGGRGGGEFFYYLRRYNLERGACFTEFVGLLLESLVSEVG